MIAMWLLRQRRKPSHWRPEARLARTIQGPQHVKNAQGQWVVSSAAFSPSKKDKACSVDLEQLLLEDGLEARSIYPHLKRSVGLMAVPLQEVRQRGLEAFHDAVLTNWYHGIIKGKPLDSPKVRKALARACQPIVPIDQAAAAALQPDQTQVSA